MRCGKAHHRLHDVLDHDDGDIFAAKPDQEIQHLVDFGAGQARHRLVGNQQLRMHRHRAGEFHLAQFHLAERSGRSVRLGGEPVRARIDIAASRPSAPRRRRQDGGKIERDHQVFDDRHAPERPRNLEAAGDAAMRAHMWRQLGDVLAAKEHGAGLRAECAGNAVDQRRLARAVRSDQSEALALADIDADIVQRDEAAEGFGNGVDPQQRRPASAVGEVMLPPARIDNAADQTDDAVRRRDDEQHQHGTEHQHVDFREMVTASSCCVEPSRIAPITGPIQCAVPPISDIASTETE